jgi:hypothetical protein
MIWKQLKEIKNVNLKEDVDPGINQRVFEDWIKAEIQRVILKGDAEYGFAEDLEFAK